MSSHNRFFVVRNVSTLGTGTQVASGTITGSPALFGGEVVNGDYILVKMPEGGTEPVGASVVELDSEEAKIAPQTELFNGGTNTSGFIAKEQEVSQELRREFMVAQSALPIAAADALFTALEPTSHALSAGSLNLSYFRFNAAAIDQATKDTFNPLFEDFFKKFPRTLA